MHINRKIFMSATNVAKTLGIYELSFDLLWRKCVFQKVRQIFKGSPFEILIKSTNFNV